MYQLNNVHQVECLQAMSQLPDKSVDMILCDLPYGTTANKWDTVIDLPSLWAAYKRIIRKGGAIVLTAQTPFDKVLGASNIGWLKCEWIWVKSVASNFLQVKRYPLRKHENILVFCNGRHTYNPQFTEGKPYTTKASGQSDNYTHHFHRRPADNAGYRYPKSVLEFNVERGLHPTQKPVSLFKYLVETYTNPGDLVLDNCMGSGTTAIACELTGRSWLGFELDSKYIDITKKRLNELRVTC